MLSTREYWCTQQKSQCPLICLQQPGVDTQNTVSNECDPETLVYSCVCDDNSSPNITKYTQTMPYFKCTEWGTQCEQACNGDSACQSKCRSDHTCGGEDLANATASKSPSTSAGPSQTQSDAPATNTGLLGEGDNNNNSPGSGGAMAVGASYGTMAFTFAGVFVAFAFL